MAMESTQAQLDGDEDLQWGLGIDGSGPKKPGRPPLIETSALLRRRDNLLGAIEDHWADFAWDLRRGKSFSPIRTALQPLRERREFELFVSEPTQFTTWNGMRKTRHEAASLLESVRTAIGEERRKQERLDSV